MADQSYPKWINIYLWIATVLAGMFSILAYVQPSMQFGTWEALGAGGALSLAGPLGLYISRNLANAVVGIYSLTKKSSVMIEVYLVLRIITDGADAIHNFIGGNMQGAIFAVVMLVIELIAFRKLKQ